MKLATRLAIVLSAGLAAAGCSDLVGVDFGAAHLASTDQPDATSPGPDAGGGTDGDGASNHDAAKDAKADAKDGKTDAPAGPCEAKTCEGLGVSCGAEDDGCGGVLQCGSCASNALCTKGKCACEPTTCPALGATCGIQDDGCGHAINCGTCLASEECTDNACVCKPTTCAASGATCGDIPDGCGSTLDCGACTDVTNPVCGGSAPNVCGPTPCTPTSCGASGKNCGTISDGCGNSLACGPCTAPQTCGGAGVANVCGCTPTTCATQGKNCGSISDGCGAMLDCGACTAPDSCDGAGAANVCGCTPTTCAALGAKCGAPSNDCGGTLSCGTCAAGVCYESACCTPKVCTVECGGSIPNGCGGVAICPPCTCFGAGTPITMADHTERPVESVRVGDRVLGYDAETSAWVVESVAHTSVHRSDEGTGVFIIVNGGLRLTSNHPVWASGHSTRAASLRVGDTIVTHSASGDPVTTTVRTLDRVASRESTYDLDVDGPGNFVAAGIVVVDKIIQQ